MSDDVQINEQASLNTDREIWRKGGGDGNGMSYYEPTINVTAQDEIAIEVGGMVYVKPVEEWHRLAALPVLAAGEDAEIERLRRVCRQWADDYCDVEEQRDEAREQLADCDKTIAAVRGAVAEVARDHTMPPNKDSHGYDYRMGWWDAVTFATKHIQKSDRAALADPGQWEAERYIVHVAEIRLHETDPWDVCEVGVYPIVGGLEATIASLSDRLDVELDRQQETDRKRWVTRTLGGKLREVRVETVHRGGESYFRHRIMRADNCWLTSRSDRGADSADESVLGVALGPADGEQEQANDGHATEHDDHGQQDGRHDTTVGGDGGSRLVEDDERRMK